MLLPAQAKESYKVSLRGFVPRENKSKESQELDTDIQAEIITNGELLGK